MRKVYKDNMFELKEIINSPDAARIQYLAIAKDEMRSLVKHADALDMFPSLQNSVNEIAQHNERLRKIKVAKCNPALHEQELNKLFDQELELENRIKTIQDTVPSEIVTKTGLRLRVTLR